MNGKSNWSQRPGMSLAAVVFVLFLLTLAFSFAALKLPYAIPIAISLLFILLDYAIFLFAYHSAREGQRGDTDNLLSYEPDLRIWAFGIVLGIAILILFVFLPDLHSMLASDKWVSTSSYRFPYESRPDVAVPSGIGWEVAYRLGFLSLILGFVSVLIFALVKVVKED